MHKVHRMPEYAMNNKLNKYSIDFFEGLEINLTSLSII